MKTIFAFLSCLVLASPAPTQTTHASLANPGNGRGVFLRQPTRSCNPNYNAPQPQPIVINPAPAPAPVIVPRDVPPAAAYGSDPNTIALLGQILQGQNQISYQIGRLQGQQSAPPPVYLPYPAPSPVVPAPVVPVPVPPQVSPYVTPYVAPIAYNPNPIPQGYAPNPIPQGYAPNPIPQQYQPNPIPQQYQPSPIPQGYNPQIIIQQPPGTPQAPGVAPNPIPQGYSPAPITRDAPPGIYIVPGQDSRSPAPQPQSYTRRLIVYR